MDKLDRVQVNPNLAALIESLPAVFKALAQAVSSDQRKPHDRRDSIEESIARQSHRIKRITTIYYD